MNLILALAGALAMFCMGKASTPPPQVVLMKDGAMVSSSKMDSPILVIVDGTDIQVRGKKPEILSTAPFYRDGFGEWTVACKADCHEGEHPWDK